MASRLHIGFLVNPLAGLGGALALKGSDGEALRARAAQLDTGRSAARAERALAALQPQADAVHFSTWAGDMGGAVLARLPFAYQVLGEHGSDLSDAADSKEALNALMAAEVDLLLFAGGDGTARDVYDVVGQSLPVLGIPAGVKMHSGVFAVSPEAAGELLRELACGGLVGLRAQEVRDIDEEAFRQDRVKTRFYGEMLVPGEGRYLQHTKIAGRESVELVAAEIAAWIVESMEPEVTYLLGPGSTTAAIMEELNLPNTLLGVDVVRASELVASDATEAELLDIVASAPSACQLVVTAIGGQGHVFGRGNQQFSPAVIRAVGLDRIQIIAAKSKIAALEGRPLLVDTNDPRLDSELAGLHRITTGYDDHILYRLGTESEETADGQ